MQAGLASQRVQLSCDKHRSHPLARTASLPNSLSNRGATTSTKQALPGCRLAPANHGQLKSSLIDTVRVVVDARGVSLSELTAGNPRVKRDGLKYIVAFPEYSTTATLFQFGVGNNLHLEFSAPKLLTGQNIIGIHDLHELSVACIKRVFAAIDFPYCDHFRKRIENGAYRLARVDVTGHIACGTALRATALMRSIWHMLSSQPEDMKDVSAYGLETLYVGQHSGYATLKVYRKDLELLKHPLPESVFARERLCERAVGLVRVEYTMRSPRLKRLGLDDPLAWRSCTVQQQLQPWIDRLTRVDGVVPDEALVGELPMHLQQKFAAWLHGDTLAFIRGVNPETTRENRNRVLKTTGIDASCDFSPSVQKRFVLPLRELVRDGFAFKSNNKLWPKFLAGADGVAPRNDRSRDPVSAPSVARGQGAKRKVIR